MKLELIYEIEKFLKDNQIEFRKDFENFSVADYKIGKNYVAIHNNYFEFNNLQVNNISSLKDLILNN